MYILNLMIKICYKSNNLFLNQRYFVSQSKNNVINSVNWLYFVVSSAFRFFGLYFNYSDLVLFVIPHLKEHINTDWKNTTEKWFSKFRSNYASSKTLENNGFIWDLVLNTENRISVERVFHFSSNSIILEWFPKIFF